MSFLMKSLELDPSEEDQVFPEFDVRLSRVRTSTGVNLTLIHPGGDEQDDHRRYVGSLRLRAGDGCCAAGHAQLVATGDRVLGLIMAGEHAGRPVSEVDGVVVVFNVDRDELAGPEVERGGAARAGGAAFHGRAGDPFRLEIDAIVARLSDSGSGAGAGLADFLLDMTLSGVMALQRLASDVAVVLR